MKKEVKKTINKKGQVVKDEFGRSMVELVAVLAVMGLITAGAFILVRAGTASQKRSRATDEVAAIVENVRNLYKTANSFAGMTSNKAEGTALIESLDLTTTTPFGKNTTYSVIRNRNNNSEFYLLMQGLDDSDCRALASETWPTAHANASCNNGVLRILFGR